MFQFQVVFKAIMFTDICKVLTFLSLLILTCADRATKPKQLFTKEDNGIKIYKGQVSDDDWIARGTFDNQINNTGFSYLEIETNPKFSNVRQAFHAGVMEGQLTTDLIYSRWFNVVYSARKNDTKNSTLVDAFIKRNSKWIKKQLKIHSTDPYWHHVQLFYAQLDGLYQGYNNNTSNDKKLKFMDILWLNLMVEIPDIKSAINLTSSVDSDHCSVLIKIMPDNKDVYFGHNTWIGYEEMLRVMKKYILPFTKSSNLNSTVPGYEIATTSFPGCITSIDDFYLLSSGLAVTETTNEVYNKTLFSYVTPENIVWESIRSLIANRFATDGESWHNIFKQYNSGTYNNQWMVFDYKKFKPGNKLPNGTFWISEQMPTIVIVKDVTSVLNSQGYWISYNVPYIDEIFKISGYDKMVKTNGTWFSHSETPRAKIFKRDHHKVVDMNSFMALMRSNDYTHEPYAACNCTPPFSAAGAIAARKDLNPVDGVDANKRKATGAIDAKITNSSLFLKLKFVAISGPTTGTEGRLPVFKWSTSNFPNTSHMSQPDEWNFKPVLHKWSFPDNS